MYAVFRACPKITPSFSEISSRVGFSVGQNPTQYWRQHHTENGNNQNNR
jgi:hypothetical protein